MSYTKKKNKILYVVSFAFIIIRAVLLNPLDASFGALNLVLSVLLLLVEQSAFFGIMVFINKRKENDLLFLIMLLNPFISPFFGVGFTVQLILTFVLLIVSFKLNNKVINSILSLLVCFCIVFIANSALFSILPFILLFIIAKYKSIKEGVPELIAAVLGTVAATVLYKKITVLRSFCDYPFSESATKSQWQFLKISTPETMHIQYLIASIFAAVLLLAVISVAINVRKKIVHKTSWQGETAKKKMKQEHADKLLSLIFLPLIPAFIGVLTDSVGALSLLGITPVMLIVLFAANGDLFSIYLMDFAEYMLSKKTWLTCILISAYCATGLLLYTTGTHLETLLERMIVLIS